MMMKSLLTLLIAIVSVCGINSFAVHTPILASSATFPVRSSCKSNLVMRARVCDLLGKKPNRQARVVTFSHRRIKKVQEVNLQWKRFFSENLNRNVRLRVSTKAIKTVTKLGSIDEAAKKFAIDLSQF